MKIFIDTSIVVDIEREIEDTVNLIQHLILTNHTVLMSAVVASEIFTLISDRTIKKPQAR